MKRTKGELEQNIKGLENTNFLIDKILKKDQDKKNRIKKLKKEINNRIFHAKYQSLDGSDIEKRIIFLSS